MTLLADESGIETSRPREGIELIMSGVRTWRVATGTRDIVINGQTYTAYPSQRDEVSIASSKDETECSVRLPLKHPVPQRWLAGNPPRLLEVNVYRAQLDSGEFEQIWRGYVTGLSANSRSGIATLRVPSRLAARLDREVPTFTAGKLCNHDLYDRNCGVSRAAHTVATTVTSISGRTMKVAAISGNPDQWAQFGDVLHVSSNERVTIVSQVGTTLTLKAALVGVSVGDAVEVSAGCAHDVATCHAEFSNRPNFGGFPQMNAYSFYKLMGYTIYAPET